MDKSNNGYKLPYDQRLYLWKHTVPIQKKNRMVAVVVGVHVWLFVPLTLRYILLLEKVIQFFVTIDVWVNVLSEDMRHTNAIQFNIDLINFL